MTSFPGKTPLDIEILFDTIQGQLKCSKCGAHIAIAAEAGINGPDSRVWLSDMRYREFIRVRRVNHRCDPDIVPEPLQSPA